MRKLSAIAAMLVFVFAVTSAYACGEKKSSAKSSKASYEKVENSEMAKTVTADSKSEKAEVMGVDYSGTGKSSCWPKNSQASKAGVMNADAKSVDGKVDNPAVKNCPVPCVKDAKVDNMKAEKIEKEGLVIRESSQAAVAPASSSK